MSAAPEIVPARRTLAQIVQEMLDALDQADGEVTAAVDELGLDLEDKVQGYGAVIRQLRGEQKAFKELADEYEARAKSREQTIVGLKFRMDAALKALKIDKLRTPTCTVYYQSTKRVEFANEEAFCAFAPDEFVETKTYPKREAVKEVLEAGGAVEGASLVESKHIRFK